MSQSNVASGIVKDNSCCADLIWEECVFVKLDIDSGNALVNATPGGNLVLTCLVDLTNYSLLSLSDHKDLLVSHISVATPSIQLDSDVVLYLAFRVSLNASFFEKDRRRYASWQLELNRDNIVSWENAASEPENWCSVAEDYSSSFPLDPVHLHFCSSIREISRPSLLLHPIATFLSLDINNDGCGCDRYCCSHEHLSCEHLSWLVFWLV